jgi:N-acetylglucosamine-6-phosphate deacetylase
LVSDCLRPAGLPTSDILYKIGPKYMDNCALVVVEGDVAMLPDRSLFAGSLTTLDKMIKNMVQDCGIPLEKAVRMATLSPAEIIHVEKERGSLEVGKAADVCIMDLQFNVIKTLVDGKVVYSK